MFGVSKVPKMAVIAGRIKLVTVDRSCNLGPSVHVLQYTSDDRSASHEGFFGTVFSFDITGALPLIPRRLPRELERRGLEDPRAIGGRFIPGE
mgnify:FL=1